MKNIVAVSFLAVVLLLCSSSKLELKKEYRVRTVVIDAGHGGKDVGCNGKFSHEADVALKLALQVGSLIEQNLPDVKVVYTRKDDHFVELIDRAGIANKNNADLFISIHLNAGPAAAAGTETYTMGLHTSEGNLRVAKRENAVILHEDNYQDKYNGFDPNSPQSHILFALHQSAYLDNSLRFADKVEKEFKNRVGRHSRGVKQAGFLVLWKSYMPSVLIECGFLTNPAEEKFLNDKTGQTYMASGIYRAFKEYKQELEAMN
ncbi:N-acetylmuramoyl-L-alanine amidase [Pontibacter ummariensis]|uniref:N-acetylmuramoyl-L-alanine amidase n=1 Tax=Pontibacter ummariensis TaxID=1610492 RepID=A0A239BD76_9BACT|nr:N-acetylmuramoyl-L-alanine amidase [Pontibacter ummariensis]PRY16458.1 N-acetylmuramoyl-L-alanine amidase [Pontibacter ummariensis]SNS05511.1 N-acetylmuramoyl-L-alanine amidase [Pontibacter ummariensis]